MQSIRLAFTLACSLALSACAVGNKHQYAATPIEVSSSTAQEVAIAVQDQRPYVRDGDKTADFVGIQRGGFGNPFDVTTESKKPLADDFAVAIAAALRKKNVTVSVAAAPVEASPESIQADLRKSGAGRLILLALREWKSDTYTNTALIYNLSLSVLSADGVVLAEKGAQGDEDLGGSFMNPPAHAKTAVPKAFARILSGLLNDPAIVAALK